MSTPRNSLANLSKLEPYQDETLQVVIETPKGSRNKYAFDGDRLCFQLKKTLPAGMVFPYDFGFVPSTEASDGDELDVLVLMDEPAFVGCVLGVRLIGVITGEDQLPEGETQRNDRLLAVAEASDLYAGIQHVNDLPEPLMRHMEEFFQNYPRVLSQKEFKLLGTEGPEVAQKLIEEARANVK
ncbi:inorganic diphosphatase [Terriglobus aquaticus]|uniref:inorganic diphosphatase n=1 Tax=Terriglobus aquaticus TaxID=940139 RepID=A0ABW9KPT8_9BACT|nr:inorganic diphosphatase [Terriglobus aquaticus]